MAYDNESGLIPKNLTINNKLYYIRIDDVHVAFQLLLNMIRILFRLQNSKKNSTPLAPSIALLNLYTSKNCSQTVYDSKKMITTHIDGLHSEVKHKIEEHEYNLSATEAYENTQKRLNPKIIKEQNCYK